VSDSERPTTPVLAEESEADGAEAEQAPLFQRIDEAVEKEPSPLRRHAFPLVGICLLVFLAIVTSMDWRSWISEAVLPPEFALNRTEFRGLDDQRVAVDLHLDVTNPNTFGAQILSYTIAFSVDGVSLVNDRIDRVVDFRGGATDDLLIPVRVRWRELADRIAHHAARGDLPEHLPFTASGTAQVAIPGGSLSVPFNYTGDFPVVVPPAIAPCDVGIAQTSVTAVRLEVDVCVTNPNARPIGLKDVRYELRVNDRTLVEAQLGEDLKLGPREQGRVSIVGAMSVEDAGRRLVAAVLGVRTEADVRVIGAGEYESGIGTVPLHFDSSETMRPGAR